MIVLMMRFLILTISCFVSCLWAEDVRVLATFPTHVFDWAPDSRRFAFADEDGIRVAEAPTFDRPRPLPLDGWPGGASIDQIRWSPDGQWMAFVAARPGDDWQTIWLTPAGGGDARDLLPESVSGRFGSPGIRSVAIEAWRNDHEIVFSQHCGTGCQAVHTIDVNRLHYRDVCVANLDSGIDWRASRSRGIGRGHLGSLILIEPALGNEPWCPEAFKGCLDGEQGYAFQDWSPDGTRALVTRGRCREQQPDAQVGGDLLVWELGGTAGPPIARNVTGAAWSPQGSKIALVSDGKLLVLDLASGVRRELMAITFPQEEVVRPVVWSPDGVKLVARDTNGDVVVVNTEGTRRWTVAYRPALVSWSPDARWLTVQAPEEHISVTIAPVSVLELL